MLHVPNHTHITKQCRALKKEAEKHKKVAKNGDRKNTKCGYNPSKEEIHALAMFAKEQMTKEYKNVNEELKTLKTCPCLATKKVNENRPRSGKKVLFHGKP